MNGDGEKERKERKKARMKQEKKKQNRGMKRKEERRRVEGRKGKKEVKWKCDSGSKSHHIFHFPSSAFLFTTWDVMSQK